MLSYQGSIQSDFGKLFRKMDEENYTLVSLDPPGYGNSVNHNRDISGKLKKYAQTNFKTITL